MRSPEIAAGTAPATPEDDARNGRAISIASRPMDKLVHLWSRAVMERVFVACALACFLGCGSKKGSAEDSSSAEAIKTPATVEQAARVLDLSTFPVMDGAKSAESRHVANPSYLAIGDVKKAFEFNRKALLEKGWKELPNTSVTSNQPVRVSRVTDSSFSSRSLPLATAACRSGCKIRAT